MAKMADVKQRGRSWLIGVALIVVGVLVGQAIPRDTAAPAAESGTLTSATKGAGGSGTAIVFQYKGSRQTFTLGDRTPWQGQQADLHARGPHAVAGQAWRVASRRAAVLHDTKRPHAEPHHDRSRQRAVHGHAGRRAARGVDQVRGVAGSAGRRPGPLRSSRPIPLDE